MTILLFGVTNVGKTTVGKALAKRLGFTFFDLDEEVKKYFNTTLSKFVKEGTLYARDKKRGLLITKILEETGDKIIALTPMYYASNFNKHLLREDVVAIELQDFAENIFERLIFSDENDVIYEDDAYKNLNKIQYIKEIKKDITAYRRSFTKVKNKFQINNDSVESVVERIIDDYVL